MQVLLKLLVAGILSVREGCFFYTYDGQCVQLDNTIKNIGLERRTT